MPNPNIVNVASIVGKTDFAAVSNVATSFVFNEAFSNTIYKVNTVSVTNNTISPIYVTLQVERPVGQVDITYEIANDVVVPANSVLVLVSKDAGFYLEEEDDMQIYGSIAGLRAMASYEIIS